jgi:hypothetical protein
MPFYPPQSKALQMEKPPAKTEIIDYNPDHYSSFSGTWLEEREDTVIMIMKVAHLGAIVIRASCDSSGELVFNGVSTFTEKEIRG